MTLGNVLKPLQEALGVKRVFVVLVVTPQSFYIKKYYSLYFLDLEHTLKHETAYRVALVLSGETTKPGVF
jgi:hypothetical protein